MKTPRAVLMLSLLTLLGLACACPAAGLMRSTQTPTLPALPTRTRAAPTATLAPAETLPTADPGEPTAALPTSPPVPTQPPAATQPTEEPLEEDMGGEFIFSPGELVGRYREAWLACNPPIQGWQEGLVFELYLNKDQELLVSEIPDAGNEFDPPVFISGYAMDLFVYGGEAHPDRFLYYSFAVVSPFQLIGDLSDDAGGFCQVVWTRLP